MCFVIGAVLEPYDTLVSPMAKALYVMGEFEHAADLMDTDPMQGIAYLEYLGEKYKVECQEIIDYCQNTTWDQKLEDLTAVAVQWWAAGKLTTKTFNVAGKGVRTVLDSELAQNLSTAIKAKSADLFKSGFDWKAGLENIHLDCGAEIHPNLREIITLNPDQAPAIINGLKRGLDNVAKYPDGVPGPVIVADEAAKKIESPQQVIDKTTRNIQTMRFKVERLEKYMADKLTKVESPVFERANLKHVFGIDKIVKERASGAFDAKYIGYHHDKGWKLVNKGKVEFLTEPKVCPKTGIVRVDSVVVEGINIGRKTFFSPDWSRHKVIDKIVEASHNIKGTFIQGNRQSLIGVTREGIEITLVIDELKTLITAYPL